MMATMWSDVAVPTIPWRPRLIAISQNVGEPSAAVTSPSDPRRAHLGSARLAPIAPESLPVTCSGPVFIAAGVCRRWRDIGITIPQSTRPTRNTVMRPPTVVTPKASSGGMTAAPIVNPMCATVTANDRRRPGHRVTAVIVERTNSSMPTVTSGVAPRNTP
jgi:hypothetical protein